MKLDLLVKNISYLVTSKVLDKSKFKNNMENIEILEDAYFGVIDGKIAVVGTGEVPCDIQVDSSNIVDAGGHVVSPGLVDSHTHLVFYGSRENELAMKLDGVPYLEILRRGGGIISSVRATRNASYKELYDKAFEVLNYMLKCGVTTVEAKSGYGLDLDNELKQLEVMKDLHYHHCIDVVSTFLGAHATPPEYKDRTDDYVDEVIRMLPIVKERNLAEFCDVFCDSGVFDAEQSRKILEAAKELNYKIKIHSDEIDALGGTELAGELGATSAEHLMVITDSGIEALRKAGVVADILPATSFNLGKPYAPVRKIIDAGVDLALSTDYNPGSCPCPNMQLVMQIGSAQLRMRPQEIFKAVTINGAKAVDRQNIIGSIEVGKQADFVIYDTKNIDYIFYNFGVNHVRHVYKKGVQVVKDGAIINM